MAGMENSGETKADGREIGMRPKRRRCVCAFEADRAATLNIEVLGPSHRRRSRSSGATAPTWSSGATATTSSSPYCTPPAGRFGSPLIIVRREPMPESAHNCLQETLDWEKLECQDFLRLAKEVVVEDLFECIITDKLYSKTGERDWNLDNFVLQRKDRRMFIGGQGVVLFIRRQGHSTSLAMKVCFHRRDKKKVERHVQRTILHIKAQETSQFIGKILINYLTRRFFITIMPKAKFVSLKSLKQEIATLPDASIRYYFACITSALVKLHSINICHRDIKCDNVLVMHNGAPALVDFGLAVKGTQDLDVYRQNARATQMQYYPPETKQVGNLINDYKIDSWLLGFFLSEMVFPDREHLWTKFKNSSHKDWRLAICQACQIPKHSPLTSLLPRLLVRDPHERIHVADVQYLPYLHDNGYYGRIEQTQPPPILQQSDEMDRKQSEG